MIAPGILPLSIIRGIQFDSLILQFSNQNVTVSGTLNPNVAGNFINSGTYATFPLYILEGSPSTFCYYNTAATSYVIARLLTDAALTDYWVPAAPITTPTGTYLPHGANTGTATVTNQTIDLTGYGVEARVRRTVNASDVLIDLMPTVSSPSGGQVTIPAITAANTNAIGFVGKFMWDLVLTQAGARFGPYVTGSFTISDNITQFP